MPDLWTDLLACMDLRLRPSPSHPGADDPAPTPDPQATLSVFEGPNQELEYHRLFGGQLLAQSLRAAVFACPDKSVKSVHVMRSPPTAPWWPPSRRRPCCVSAPESPHARVTISGMRGDRAGPRFQAIRRCGAQADTRIRCAFRNEHREVRC